MKIKKSQLKQIIQEELAGVLGEAFKPFSSKEPERPFTPVKDKIDKKGWDANDQYGQDLKDQYGENWREKWFSQYSDAAGAGGDKALWAAQMRQYLDTGKPPDRSQWGQGSPGTGQTEYENWFWMDTPLVPKTADAGDTTAAGDAPTDIEIPQTKHTYVEPTKVGGTDKFRGSGNVAPMKEQLKQIIMQELAGVLLEKEDPIEPAEIPNYIAGLKSQAAGADVSAGMAMSTLQAIVAAASENPEFGPLAMMATQALEEIPEEAEKAAKDAMRI